MHKIFKAIDEAAAILGMIAEIDRESLSDFTLTFGYEGQAKLGVYSENPAVTRKLLRDCGIPNRWKKEYDDWYCYYRREWFGIQIEITTARGNVCKKVETGATETVEVPDYSATPTKTVTRPVTVWECK